MTNEIRLTGITVIVLLSACAGSNNYWHTDTGIKSSDPHLSGSRNMNYDHMIVPGDRIGPVRLSGSVQEVVQHLGEPSRVNRSTFRGPGYSSDEVYYYYDSECISFTWTDSGVEPEIENGWRGINVWCGNWSTADGIRVGTSMREVVNHLGQYCANNRNDGSLLVATKGGIWYWASDRNSPVSRISIVPKASDWGGMCKD